MKFNEKWTLFAITTFVTFFGIVDTLLKKTSANEIVFEDVENVIQEENVVMDNTSNHRGTGLLSYSVNNCLSSVELSEGMIDFDFMTDTYFLQVSNFEQLEVYPKLLDESFSYLVEKNTDDEEKRVTITVMDQNNNFKVYTIYVTESACSCMSG